ncbi:MAG TPA: bile acid:sodium symporter, partial [Saprospiraceae bacterium]|nr:bile acid:sodium symporter [Saprospiraceae bacterium]
MIDLNFIDVLNTIVLISIMFGVGTSLTVDDFRHLSKHPQAWVIGMILQMLWLPAMAFLIAWLAPLSDAYKVGLFILALCPGGTTSNFVSFLVDANVALSISLTTVNSFLILFTIPFFANLGLEFFLTEEAESSFSLPVGETAAQVFGIILTPALLGFLYRRYQDTNAQKVQQFFKWINLVLLALVYAIKFFFGEQSGGSGISWAEVWQILPYALLLHLLTMFSSYWMAKRKSGLSELDATTIGIEVGLQNTTLALLITSTLIGNEEMSKPALVTA